MLALGVPTVVDAAAIIGGTLAALKEHWARSTTILPPDLDDEAREYTEQRSIVSAGTPVRPVLSMANRYWGFLL